MTPAKADRLVRRAVRLPRGAFDSWLADRAHHRASQQVEQAGERGDSAATDALWRVWVAGRREETSWTGLNWAWDLLSRWQRPASTGDPAHVPSLIALDHEAFMLRKPHHRAALIDAARGVGPLADKAERKIDELWDAWLAEPDELVWTFLSEWGRPPTKGKAQDLGAVALGYTKTLVGRVRGPLVEAARYSPHPIGATARRRILELGDPELADAACAAALEHGDEGLAAFCVEHQLVPRDKARRAAFLLWTGQTEQYQAVDPDGSLLSRAYRAAAAPERERLRAAMLDVGGLDAVRVLVGSGLRRLGPDDYRYVCRRLRERQEWAQLWDLARDLPLLEAVWAVRMCGDAWRPADDRGRVLFDRIRVANTAALSTATKELVRTIALDGAVSGGAFSADGRHLAIGAVAGFGGADVHVVDLADDSLVARHHLYDCHVRSAGITPSGHGFCVATRRGIRWLPEEEGPSIAVHGPGECLALAPTTRGAVALGHFPRIGPSYHPNPGQGMWFVAHDGTLRRHVHVGRGQGWDALAATAAGTRVALGGPHGVALHDGDTGVLRHRWPMVGHDGSPIADLDVTHRRITRDGLTFVGSYFLAAITETGHLRSWTVADSGLVPLRAAHVGSSGDHSHWSGVVAIPGHDEVALLGMESKGVSYWDAIGIRPVAGSRPFVGERHRSMWTSLDGTLLAAGHDRTVEIVPSRFVTVAAFTRQPLADAVPADLGAVSDVLATSGLSPAVRTFLELLYRCLDHRFGSEVALGKATSAAVGGPHDIGLSPTEGSSG